MNDEYTTALKEIKHLKTQNGVLERDIHSCNFERLQLTKMIETQKKILNEIIDELEREQIK